MRRTLIFLLTLLFQFIAISCNKSKNEAPPTSSPISEPTTVEKSVIAQPISYNIPIRSYFEFMDSLVAHLDTTLNYKVDEHIIVQHNLWLIDTLENTDYYRMMERGIFEEDSQRLFALRKGQKLIIPDSLETALLLERRAATIIDVNIPEFKLRIIENDSVLYTFPVRVGRVAKKYLAMAGRKVDLRTQTGTGTIIRINRSPAFINPSNNKRYYRTKRDDGRYTKLPRVPWIEPELDGQRHGQLIHPTTNPETLGKAYSNGCIGMNEADMWRLYYHAPLGTKVEFRYDLEVINEQGDTIMLKNIYPGFEHKKKRKEYATASIADISINEQAPIVCYCGK